MYSIELNVGWPGKGVRYLVGSPGCGKGLGEPDYSLAWWTKP